MAFQSFTDFQGSIPSANISLSSASSHPLYTNSAAFYLENSELKDAMESARSCLDFSSDFQTSELLAEIQKSAGRIVFYLSCSNW
jgi:hypothetical protein